MAKSFAQCKGIRGERAVIELLQPIIDSVYMGTGMVSPKLQRNTLQADGGGYDIVGIDWLALEVKRCETLNLNAWHKQCVEQAKPHQTPVLIYKQNRGKWNVRMHALLVPGGASNLKVWAEVPLEAFLAYFEARLLHTLKGGQKQ